jgi:hypothetical protein
VGGPELDFVMGSGGNEEGRALISGLDNGYALLSSGPVSAQAAAYRSQGLDVGEPAGTFTLFWSRSETPENLNQWRLRMEGGPKLT